MTDLDRIEAWRRRERDARERREGMERLIRERREATPAMHRALASANIAEGIARSEIARGEGDDE